VLPLSNVLIRSIPVFTFYFLVVARGGEVNICIEIYSLPCGLHRRGIYIYT